MQLFIKKRAPEIVVQDRQWWINSKPLTMEGLRGKVVLIDIWDYTCINCIRTLPYIRSWHEKYAKDGLVIVAVHTPEFAFAKNKDNVLSAVRKFAIKYPVVMDNDYKIWNSFNNMYWPRKFLIDKEGNIRYDHAGEGNYEETEKMIQTLLQELKPGYKAPKFTTLESETSGKVCYPMTPELYLGYERGRIGNKEGYKPEQEVQYKPVSDEKLGDGNVYAEGTWLNKEQALVHQGETKEFKDDIAIRYHALSVNIVIKPENAKVHKVLVTQDGKPVKKEDAGEDLVIKGGESYLEVKDSGMYNVVKNVKYGQHTLRLFSNSDGLGFYAFTFGSCEVG
jgi:thiol-disulfide isomerase/thioredoxin